MRAAAGGTSTSTTSTSTTSTTVAQATTTTTTGSTTTGSSTTTTTTVPSTTTTVPGPTTTSPASNVAAIRAEQAALVSQAHQVAIDVADLEVTTAQTTVAIDQLTLHGDRADASATAGAADAAQNQLASDLADFADATAVNQAAQGRLALDRDQLRGLALGVYTGALTGPEPPALESLATQQEADVARGEAEIVAEVVVKNLHADVTAGASAGRLYHRAQAAVANDRRQLGLARRAAATAAARVPPDVAAVVAAQRQLATAQRQLQQAHAQLTAALTAVLGPAAADGSLPASSATLTNGLSVLGTSALNAAELAAWYNAQGYADLTAAPIAQLAGWYIQAGAAEGLRGDIAFAQAVLETGGFSSPDAVDLNNYAGIGHCDSCAAGWPFPSPHAGVIGHLQLLRIFATTAPAPRGAPPPVLPVLTPAKQGRAGCCPTWESLAGVWASDPLYALSILTLYQSMLSFAASLPSTADAAGGGSSTATSAGQAPTSAGPASTAAAPVSPPGT